VARRTLYRRVFWHGVLLLVALSIALSITGVFIGRDPRFRFIPVSRAEPVVRLLKDIPEETLPSAVARVAAALDVDLAVYTVDGALVAAGGLRTPRPLPKADAERLVASGAWRRDGHRTTSGPLGGQRYLRLATRLSGPEYLGRALGALIVIVLVVSLVSIPYARAIARPMEHLTRVARRWGAGELTARAHLDRADEIGELARTFDETAERLQQLLASQRELVANVSHELRTPLARMRVSLALAAEATPEDVPRHLAAIEGDAEDLERLIADLLTSSRLDAGGGLALQRSPAAPAALVEEALARFARSHPGRVVESRLGEAPTVSVEAGLIARALDNVLDNAAKYSDAEKPVAVTLDAADGGARVVVRDQGIGVAVEEHARVFEPFFRSDKSRARDTGGTGLGLALSKKIVDAHGGRITIDSRPGEGTAVTIWLPA
jgi:signal transduction histidine kinase